MQACALGCCLITACARTTHRPAAFEAPRPPAPASRPGAIAKQSARLVKPCEPTSPAYREAHERLLAIDRAIEKLEPDADPKGVVQQLVELGKSPCFDIGGRFSESDLWPGPDSAASLKDFWLMGRAFIEGYLNLHEPGQVLYATPGFRPTLSAETNPDHPLAHWACSLKDEDCTPTTRPWRRRAQMFFDQLAELETERHSDKSRACFEEAEGAPRLEQFGKWTACLEAYFLPVPELPVGGIREQKNGELLLLVGDYGGCYALWHSDLASGRTQRLRRCLKARENNARWKFEQPRTGSVSLDYLREAVWGTLLSPELSAAPQSGMQLPRTVLPVLGENRWAPDWFLDMRACTDHPSADWIFLHDKKPVRFGSLSWPPSCTADMSALSTAKNDYPVQLLEIALASFEPTAAQRPLSAAELRALAAELVANDPASDRIRKELSAHACAAATKPETVCGTD